MLEKWPSKPATEFARMKGAATAEVARVSDQPMWRSSGLRKIPPPTPVRPERNPIASPDITAAHNAGGRGSRDTDFNADRNIQTAAYRSTTPTSTLYQRAGRAVAPPTNAAGMDATANGQNKSHLNNPARWNFTVATAETRMLRASAVGFMAAGLKLKSPITAR